MLYLLKVSIAVSIAAISTKECPYSNFNPLVNLEGRSPELLIGVQLL